MIKNMGRLNGKAIEIFVKRMEEMYPEAGCALTFDNHFQLLTAVMLSAQTTDKSVNQVTPTLFREYPDALAIANAEAEILEGILRPIGMYKTKAKNLQGLSRMLVEKYDGQVPEDYDRLVELPGVGRKTANVVLSVGFGWQRIAVDTHVFRLANRIGLVQEKDVLKTELALMKVLPKEKWSLIHHGMIYHGRQICMARRPKCNQCHIYDICKKNNI